MRRFAALVAVAGIAVTGCGSGDPGPQAGGRTTTATPAATTTTTVPTSTKPEPRGTVIATGDSPFGEMLFAGDGQAIYLFDEEKTAKPECYGFCADAWPPVLTKGEPRAEGDTNAGLLGTVERTDGKLQVTYNDHPLYTYANEAPHEVECHNVDHAGGLWYVVRPDGDPAPA